MGRCTTRSKRSGDDRGDVDIREAGAIWAWHWLFGVAGISVGGWVEAESSVPRLSSSSHDGQWRPLKGLYSDSVCRHIVSTLRRLRARVCSILVPRSEHKLSVTDAEHSDLPFWILVR